MERRGELCLRASAYGFVELVMRLAEADVRESGTGAIRCAPGPRRHS